MYNSDEDFRGITESTADWEAGNAEMPAARFDYSRTSQAAAVEDFEDEANSDLGNLGRDVKDAEPVGAGSR